MFRQHALATTDEEYQVLLGVRQARAAVIETFVHSWRKISQVGFASLGIRERVCLDHNRAPSTQPLDPGTHFRSRYHRLIGWVSTWVMDIFGAVVTGGLVLNCGEPVGRTCGTMVRM